MAAALRYLDTWFAFWLVGEVWFYVVRKAGRYWLVTVDENGASSAKYLHSKNDWKRDIPPGAQVTMNEKLRDSADDPFFRLF